MVTRPLCTGVLVEGRAAVVEAVGQGWLYQQGGAWRGSACQTGHPGEMGTRMLALSAGTQTGWGPPHKRLSHH